MTTHTHTKRPYTKFYLTMLILSTIGTALSVAGFIAIPQTISEFSIAPLYGVFSLIVYLNVLISVLALVLLFKKNVAGIWIKLSTYVVSIFATIGTALTVQPIIDLTITQAKEEAVKSPTQLDPSFFDAFIPAVFNGYLILSVISALIFGTLWWFAWRNQVKSYDE